MSKPLVMLIGQSLIVFPEFSPTAPRCVAMAGPKKRCTWPIAADHGHWEVVSFPTMGEITAARLSPGDILFSATDADRWLRQRCRRHLATEITEAAPVDWEPFDLDRHGGLIKPFALEWSDRGVIDSRARAAGRQQPIYPLPAVRSSVQAPIRTALYRWFDETDRPLYYGITDNLAARQDRHALMSTWTEFVATCHVEWFDTRYAAEEAERDLIKADQPLFNRQHNDTPEARARLVAYLVEKGRLDLLTPAVQRG